ncbi:aldo/keto reductase [Schlegelella sp. S2-27]|uniref:Aldo/keto reductase n=1 Tax=Caldimonas mangrovi TaxID=2944811 RepID=A0ABT0YS35_9BURK|nr:aldo/keto reductase [Caldimonas mangrovi]MCM5680673.1 aldo/keto reductase [Caldimonas mangrovi]
MRVSPLALGTMTFGSDWGWGADDAEARRIFDAYVDRGGNIIDTAINYTNGASERILGQLLKGKRDRVVISTKFTMSRDPGDPNSGGNHRMNLVRSVEASLKQLGTDRIELLHVHAWDFTTSADEVMRALDDLVRSGKVLYLGICNTPAWKVAQLQTLAELRGWSPLVALQIEYSLVERSVEHELMPMAREMGLGVMPWSPLAGGILTGKYSRDDLRQASEAGVSSTRKGVIASSGHMTEQSLEIAGVVGDVARAIGATPSQVALAWTLLNPAVAAPVIGARTLAQVQDNLGALDIQLADEHVVRLNDASAPAPIFPARFVSRPMVQTLIFGGAQVQRRV